MAQIQPPPYQSAQGSTQWHEWYRQMNQFLSAAATTIGSAEDVTITGAEVNDFLVVTSGTTWTNITKAAAVEVLGFDTGDAVTFASMTLTGNADIEGTLTGPTTIAGTDAEFSTGTFTSTVEVEGNTDVEATLNADVITVAGASLSSVIEADEHSHVVAEVTDYVTDLETNGAEYVNLAAADSPVFAGLDIETGNIVYDGRILAPDGTQALPSYGFTNDTDSGVYLISAGALGIGVGNTGTVRVSNSYVRVGTDGSAGNPCLQIGADADTGLFQPANNQMAFAAGANDVLRMVTGVYTPSATGGDQGLGTINAEGLYIDGTALGSIYAAAEHSHVVAEVTDHISSPWVKVASGTTSAEDSQFYLDLGDNHDVYKVMFWNLGVEDETSGAYLQMSMSTDEGSSYTSGGYRSWSHGYNSTPGQNTNNQTSRFYLGYTTIADEVVSGGWRGEILIYSPGSSTYGTQIIGQVAYRMFDLDVELLMQTGGYDTVAHADDYAKIWAGGVTFSAGGKWILLGMEV